MNFVPAIQNLSLEAPAEGRDAGRNTDLKNSAAGKTESESRIEIQNPAADGTQINPDLSNEQAGKKASGRTGSIEFAGLILYGWLAGAVLTAAFLGMAHGMIARSAIRLPLCRDVDILKLFEDCKKTAGIEGTKILLRIGGETPMLHGLLSPTVILPKGYSKGELSHVMIHELCHYKHRDILINRCSCLLLSLYWYNPVLWICFFALRRDLEVLCDETAIGLTGRRKEYAETLLKTAMRKNQAFFAVASMQNGEREVSRRIKLIASFQRPKAWISGLAIIAVLTAGAFCLTDASGSVTLRIDVGEGYQLSIPENWSGAETGDQLFYDSQGVNFGGTEFLNLNADTGYEQKSEFGEAVLPLPNHAHVLERRVLTKNGITMIVINLEMDAETAAQTEARYQTGDRTPPEPMNQNHIFLQPEPSSELVFSLWANSDTVTEKQLIRIAETFKRSPKPWAYQPEGTYSGDWGETAEKLLKGYFQNYVHAKLPVTTDISGYRIEGMKPYEGEGSWRLTNFSRFYKVMLYSVDYTLNIADPRLYDIQGSGFELGEENTLFGAERKTITYKNQLAVFALDGQGTPRFIGFVDQDTRDGMGEVIAIHSMIKSALPDQSGEFYSLKTPYIGDASKVGRIVQKMPLFQYSNGMQLHTKEEPYGLTVAYDLTRFGGMLYDESEARAPTDSRGWDPTPYLKAQLFQNSAVLLSLIDNCSTVELVLNGRLESGAPYTYHFLLDQQVLEQELGINLEKQTSSPEEYRVFFEQLDEQYLKALKAAS
jgi:beta-lactamase regulating signal transducer with metallopeptidase domain